MKKTLKLLYLSFLLYLLSTHNALAVTTFDVTIKDSGGDWTSITSAEAALDVDITNATTSRVFNFDANSGTIPDATACSTDGGATTGICVHQSVGNQILIVSISGGTFDDNDVVADGGGHTVTLSNNGDESNIIVTVYSNELGTTFDGGTYDAVHYILYQGDTTNWDGKGGGVQISTMISPRDPYQYIKNFVLTIVDGWAYYAHTATPTYGINLIAINGGLFYCYNTAGNGGMILINSVSIGSASFGFANYYITTPDMTCYNCVSINAATYGFWQQRDNSGADVTCYNCVAVGSGTADYAETYGDALKGDYNASGDTTSGDFFTHYINGVVTANNFVDAVGWDIHLKAGNVLGDAGNDYSGTSGVNYDIDRVVVTGTWPIGADEYIGVSSRRKIIMIQ